MERTFAEIIDEVRRDGQTMRTYTQFSNVELRDDPDIWKTLRTFAAENEMAASELIVENGRKKTLWVVFKPLLRKA